jgi:predicted alpha/beta superfamily hydrolase
LSTTVPDIVSSPDASLRTALRRFFRLENRRAAVRPGRLEHVADLDRLLTVYLPAGYDERDDRRYPVLYMHDGQNLFDAHRAYIPGQHWRLQEAADAAIGERTASPMIIVGIDHAGPARIDEYTPTADPDHGGGGRADEYAGMLFETLKPAIDERYRTVSQETYVGGSSLGGLVSLYLALKHPIQGAAVMSPSVWWNDRVILQQVDAYDGPRPRLWVDIGGREGADAIGGARALRDRLLANGWNDETLRYYEDRRADHSERSWAKRVRLPLEFLFPPA